MGLQNKFSDNDPYVQTQQTLCSNNNLIALNTAIADTDYLRGSSVAIGSQSLNRVVGTPFPSVAGAASATVGAALSGEGQAGTPSEEPGGGGVTCFIGHVRISTPTGDVHIREIKLGDTVWAFDSITGVRIPKRVIGKWEHLVEGYTLVEFNDGHSTGVIDIHRYWTKNGQYREIKNIEDIWHWDNEAGQWIPLRITQRTFITGEVIVYNLTVKDEHNYIANGDAVSNLKPLGAPEV